MNNAKRRRIAKQAETAERRIEIALVEERKRLEGLTSESTASVARALRMEASTLNLWIEETKARIRQLEAMKENIAKIKAGKMEEIKELALS